MTELRFVGDLRIWYGIPLALVAGIIIWKLYRRETRSRKDVLSWLLPLLRTFAVILLILLLTEPVLRHRWIVGQLARILVFVDNSQSMSVTDENMSADRKLLAAVNLGYLSDDLLPEDILTAQQALDRAQRRAEQLPATDAEKTDDADLQTAAQLLADLEEAYNHLKKIDLDDDLLPAISPKRTETTGQISPEGFRRELLEPARSLTKNKKQDRKQFTQKLSTLSLKAGDWHRRIRRYFERWARKLSLSGKQQVRQALQHFEGLTRRQRIQALLLEGENPLLAELAENHHVELIAFDDADAQSLWRGRAGELNIAGRLPTFLPGEPDAGATNLSLSLDAAINQAQANSDNPAGDENPHRLAAVLFTDGRHNHGPSPLQLAKTCGAKEIPVFTVGIGSTRIIEDLAVVRTEHPTAVFHKDRVKGRVILKDDMQPDRPFTLMITSDEKTLWQKELKTDGTHLRFIDYDFPVEKFLQEKVSDAQRDLSYKSIPLNLNVEITGLEKLDTQPANDRKSFRLRANFQKNKILLLAGRPRWEFRYVHNLFERDEKWEITALIYDPTKPNGGIKRGNKSSQFPNDRESLYTYDLIILGDFLPALLKQQEWLWLRDAVLLRGAGLMLIDGRREHLRDYADTPLAEIIPVKWTDDAALKNITTLRLTEKGKLRLTELGRDVAALSLATGSLNNDQVWNSLKPPHWLSVIQPLPGAEIFLEAVVEEQNVPALVFRRFGAGKVLFAAFDESWRWRYRVADEYHGKYWNQTAALIMAPQFAVSDRFVSLDTGKLIYAPGQIAQIRARIRDTEGKPVFKAVVHANIYLDDKKVNTIELVADEQSGDFSGATGKLDAGNYQVRIQVLGYPEDQMKALAQFYVQPPEAGEMTELTCDETLLRQIAAHSTGDYFREEDSSSLADRLKPLSQGRVVETETVLLRSWWWFAAVIFLLTLEWILRKRAGML